MAWIESHQSLLTHRKTIRASAMLGVSRYLLIGHLHALWWWGLDNAKDDGDLGPTQPVEIAEACGWPARKADALIDALVTAEFLDRTSDGMRLHNWYRYAGKLNEKRGKDRARKTSLQRNSSGNPSEVAGTNLTNQPTIPNQPNQPPPTNLAAPPSVAVVAPSREVALMFERGFGRLLSPTELELIKELEDEHSRERLDYAVRESVAHNVRSVSYVKKVCENDGNTDGANSRKPAAAVGAGAVAGGVSDLERRRAAVAERRRASES